MKSQILAQGAEAIISLNKNSIHKQRISKSYRLKELDKRIRSKRTEKEAKILKKAKIFGINVPELISEKEFDLEIEYLRGDKLSEKINSYERKKQFETMNKIGEQVAKLHHHDIIHGDLTTSNMILTNELFIIDFGLSFISKRVEDKAVDLHLIKQALEAKHFQNWQDLFKEFEKGYSKSYKDSKEVLERLKKVESRGRYKNSH